MQPDIEKLQKLLKEVGKIRQKHEEMARLRGEGFNIFDIFKTGENKHSDFIAELLNIKGSHGQGGKFLELFLDMLVQYGIIENKLAYQNAQVSREISLGENGRLDILLKGTQGTIYIENKIWASDQNEQIQRYHNVGKDKPNFKLLYLTPHGWESSSAGELITKEHYFPISYEKHIIEWLEACHKETADLPILRETIKQYIIHLKHLTGQAQNNEMEQELSKVILDNIAEVVLLQRYVGKSIETLLDKIITNIKPNNLKSIKTANIDTIIINFSRWDKLGIFFEWRSREGSPIEKPVFWLGVTWHEPNFKKNEPNFPKPALFNSLYKNPYWLWYEKIQYNSLQDITLPENIERIAKAIEEYAPLCDDIDKNFRKP